MDVAVSLLVITALFALIFKYLPDVLIRWGDVWIGAFITACLLIAGKYAIGFYLGTSDVGSAYGVAGSLIIIMVWIYYSSLIVFFGAELTQIWTKRKEGFVRPVAGADVATASQDTRRPKSEAPGVGARSVSYRLVAGATST